MKVFKTGPEIHSLVKKYCKDNDIFMQEFIETGLKSLIKKEKHYLMKELINELSKLIPLKEASGEIMDVMYIDFTFEKTDINQDPEISPNIFAKRIVLEIEKFNDIDHAEKFITGDYIEKIKQAAYFNRESLPKINSGITIVDIMKYSNVTDTDIRRYFTKLKIASNYITTEGRVGPANYMLINPKTYDLFSMYTIKPLDIDKDIIFTVIGQIDNVIVIADSRIEEDEIILGRKNNTDQPGIFGAYSFKDIQGKEVNFNELYYTTTSVGFYPHKQYIAIKIIKGESVN